MNIIFRFRKRIFVLIKVLFVLIVFKEFVIADDVVGKNGMVASAHPLASKAGLQILEAGGNAIDAAVATAFTLAVVEPNSSGLGGGGFMMVRTKNKEKTVMIDYRETAPKNVTDKLYYKNDKSFHHLTHFGPNSIGVPGAVAGLCLALEKYGTMNISQVTEIARKYANEGYEVSEKFESMITNAYELISMNEATAKIYLKDDFPPVAGAIIKNPDLAKTFKKLAKNGPEYFYSGEIAKSIVSQVNEKNGLLSLEDFKQYKALEKEPVKGTYRGYQIVSTAPPSGGGTHLIELLNILENYDIKKMKHNSAEYIHILAEIMKIVYADKAANMADPDYYSVPVKKITNKSYAKKLMEKISFNEASFDYQAPNWVAKESQSTTHLSVVDNDGNIVSLTQTINHWFGSGITVEETGIILNNQLADFSGKAKCPNSIKGGKRPVSSMAPTILFKDGKPFLTVGTPGGSRIIGALAQIIINIIDFEMGIDDAIEAPRIHAYNKTLHVEGRIENDVIEKLKMKGHKIKVLKDFDNYFGGAQGILINNDKKLFFGGADSRRDGVVEKY